MFGHVIEGHLLGSFEHWEQSCKAEPSRLLPATARTPFLLYAHHTLCCLASWKDAGVELRADREMLQKTPPLVKTQGAWVYTLTILISRQVSCHHRMSVNWIIEEIEDKTMLFSQLYNLDKKFYRDIH